VAVAITGNASTGGDAAMADVAIALALTFVQKRQ